jgi:NADH dehydrogenase/NADH:ubiquinone oxidoreductase subunit G
LQLARKAVNAPGEAQEDWKIITLLSKTCNKTLDYKSIFDVRDAMPELPQID